MEDLIRKDLGKGAVHVGEVLGGALAANWATKGIAKKVSEKHKADPAKMLEEADKTARIVSAVSVGVGVLGVFTSNEHAQSVGIGVALSGVNNFLSLSAKPEAGKEATDIQKKLTMLTPLAPSNLSGLGDLDDTPMEFEPQFAGALPPVADFDDEDDEDDIAFSGTSGEIKFM